MEASTAIQSRLIGAILVEKNLITGEQLERALRLQEDTGERLGEIVVAEFGIARLELASVLAEQWEEFENAERKVAPEPDRPAQPGEPLTPADVQIRRPIGEIFVEFGFISSDQLDAALDAQRETGARVGEILVEQGSLTRLELASALAEQWSALQKLRPPAPVADPKPWQSSLPVASPPAQGGSAADHVVVAELEERLRVVERAAAGTPWQEDLRLVTVDLRAAVGAVEERLEAGVLGTVEVELAAALEAVSTRIDALESVPVSTELDALQQELEGLRTRPVTVEGLADLRAAVERLEGRPDRADEIASLVARLDQLAARVEDVAATPVPDLTPRINDLSARVDDVAAAIPVVETDGLAARIESLEEGSRAGNGALESLAAELGELGSRTQARLDALASREPDLAPVDELRARVDDLAAAVEREPDTAPLDGIRARLEEQAAAVERDESVSTLEARVGELEHRLAAAAPAAELREEMRRVVASTTAERESLAQALSARVEEITATVPREDELTELRSRLDELAARPTEDHVLQARVDEVSARLEGLGAVEGTIAGLRESLEGLDAVRVGDALATGARLAGLEAAVDSLAGLEARVREGVDRDRPDRAEALAARLDGAESRLDTVVALEERVAALAAELERRPDDDALAGVAAEQATWMRAELEAQWNETAALRARVEELQETAAGRAASEARLESMLEQRLDGLAGRITEEVAGARADAEQATAAVRGETGSLGARIDELLGLRQADVQTARAASERLTERVEALAGLRADDAEAARVAAADLSTRLESLAGSLHAEAADARRAAAGVALQIGDLRGLRADDLAAAELAGAELAARLDDHAVRSAAAAFQVEQALRAELGGVAARLEERDVQGIEAREELRGELERVASSVGWRLERIEESLASDDPAELKATVTELERRLEGQVAMGEEQVRVTERALRKGLASLGERLVDSESAYLAAGNTLRRSIERLGAAVVEADARMADQIPVAEAEGCVAFAPTAAGYRLVELPGKPPEVGSTVELEGCDGPLAVTRYGRSPLPLDNRPCAYLDRA